MSIVPAGKAAIPVGHVRDRAAIDAWADETAGDLGPTVEAAR